MNQTQSSERSLAPIPDQPNDKPDPADQDAHFYTDNINNMFHFNLSTAGLTAALILQTALLFEEKYYNIDQNHIGTTLSVGLIIQIITYMSLSKLYTQMSQKYGNKIMALYGGFSYLLGSLLYLTHVPILSEFFVSQFLLSNGFIALYTVPFDVEDEPDRTPGEAAKFSTSSVFISAQFATVVIAVLNYYGVPLGYNNAIISILVFLGIILNSIGLTSENLSHEELEAIKKFDEAKKTVKEDGWLMILAVLKAGQSVCFVGFLTFSIVYYRSILPSSLADPNNLIFAFQLILFLLSNMCLRVYATNLDKENPGITLGLALVVPMGAALSWILLTLAKTYPDKKILLAGLFMAVGMPGFFILSDYIYRKNTQVEHRLPIRQFLRKIQLIPAIVIVLAAGLLCDHWRKDAPLFVASGVFVIIAVAVKKVQSTIEDKKKND